MTPHATALVTCPTCEGTMRRDDGATCSSCNSGHIAIDRTPDGGIPDGFVEWVPPLLIQPEPDVRP